MEKREGQTILNRSYGEGYRNGFDYGYACGYDYGCDITYRLNCQKAYKDGKNEMRRKAGKLITANRYLFFFLGALSMLLVVLLINAWQYHMGGQWKMYKDFPIIYGDTASQLLIDIPRQVAEETGLDIRVAGAAADDMRNMHYIYAGRHVFRVFIKRSPYDIEHDSALIDIILVSADDYY